MNSYIKSIELKCISLDASNNFSLDQDTITGNAGDAADGVTRKLRRFLLPDDVTSLSCLRWRFGPDQGEVAGTEFHTLTLSYLFLSTCILPAKVSIC